MDMTAHCLYGDNKMWKWNLVIWIYWRTGESNKVSHLINLHWRDFFFPLLRLWFCCRKLRIECWWIYTFNTGPFLCTVSSKQWYRKKYCMFSISIFCKMWNIMHCKCSWSRGIDCIQCVFVHSRFLMLLCLCFLKIPLKVWVHVGHFYQTIKMHCNIFG